MGSLGREQLVCPSGESAPGTGPELSFLSVQSLHTEGCREFGDRRV